MALQFFKKIKLRFNKNLNQFLKSGLNKKPKTTATEYTFEATPQKKRIIANTICWAFKSTQSKPIAAVKQIFKTAFAIMNR